MNFSFGVRRAAVRQMSFGTLVLMIAIFLSILFGFEGLLGKTVVSLGLLLDGVFMLRALVILYKGLYKGNHT